jgi:hypothetical protein
VAVDLAQRHRMQGFEGVLDLLPKGHAFMASLSCSTMPPLQRGEELTSAHGRPRLAATIRMGEGAPQD